MSEEAKKPEEQVEEQVETKAEEAAVNETEEKAAEETTEAAKEEQPQSCCAKAGGHINFWKLACVFLLLAWAIQNWRLSKAEDEAKKLPPYIKGSLSCPASDDEPMLMDQVMQQMDQLNEYVSSNSRGAAPALINTPEDIYFKMFVPGLKDYKVNSSVDKDILTVKGTGTATQKTDKAGSVMLSNSVSNFDYKVKLPCAVKTDKMKIDSTDNILTITLPKVTPDPVPEAKSCCPLKKAPEEVKKAPAPEKK